MRTWSKVYPKYGAGDNGGRCAQEASVAVMQFQTASVKHTGVAKFVTTQVMLEMKSVLPMQ
jgi:hypothetical protein